MGNIRYCFQAAKERESSKAMNAPAPISEELSELTLTLEIVRDPAAAPLVWLAQIVERPGCAIQAATLRELHAQLRQALPTWLETHLAEHPPLPDLHPA
jgi:predicted RNase H-like HicB family nuclease